MENTVKREAERAKTTMSSGSELRCPRNGQQVRQHSWCKFTPQPLVKIESDREGELE